MKPPWRLLRTFWGRPRSRLGRAGLPCLFRPVLEWLEDRTLLAATTLLGTAPSPPGLTLAGPALVSAKLTAHPTFVHFTPKHNTPAQSPGPVGFTPDQIRTAYGINSIVFGGITGDGTGQTIAIVDAYNDPNALSELDGFDNGVKLASSSTQTLFQQYGPATSFFSVYNQSGTNITSSIATSGQNGVPTVDPTQAGPGADDWEVEEALDIEWAHAIAPGAKIDLVEANSPSNDLYTAVTTAAALPGVSVVSMSWGTSESTDETSLDTTFTTPSGHQGVTFLASTGDSGSPGEYPASSPNVVAVGGTTLTLDTQNNYQSEVGWSGSGGGLSPYETEPDYQTGVQNTGQRTTRDVALDADPTSGVAIYDSYNNGTTTPWEQLGGTSFSVQAWGALIAITNQGRTQAGGTTLDSSTKPTQTADYLYSLASSNFHDITQGSNGQFSAGPGYDEVTGIGTPVANLLVPALADYTPTASQLVIATQPPSYVTNGSTFSVTIQATDLRGNLATSFDGTVTVSLATNPGNATIGGTLTEPAVNGVATFPDLTIDNPGSGYQLLFAATLKGQPQSTQSTSLNVVNDLEVITTADTNQPGSLRAAVQQANEDAALGLNDTITFAPILNGATLTLTSGLLELTAGSGTTTINGGGQISINGNHASQIFQIDSVAAVVLTGLTLEAGYGGAISNAGNLTVSNATLTGDQGGIDNAGLLTVSNDTFVSNSFSINNLLGGTTTVSFSTFSGNSGPLDNEGTLTVSSCTISGNSGDGIATTGILTLENTIVAGNAGADISGSITNDNGYNLLGTDVNNNTNDPQLGSGDVFNDNPALTPLGNYGGPTRTMALLPGSPALSAGTIIAGLTTDQRGLPLPISHPDIGAWQTQVNPFEVTTTADPGLALGQLSLREAVSLATAFAAAGDSETVTFAPSLNGATILLSQGVLELTAGTGTITIDGAGQITISGNQASSVFLIDSNAEAVFTGLTIADGNAGSDNGGGIDNAGTLTVNSSMLTGNSAYNGAGIENESSGVLTVANTTFGSNLSAGDIGGGGIDNAGTCTVSNSTFTRNTNSAVSNEGEMTLRNSTLSANSGGSAGGDAGVGGGIYNYGNLTVVNATITANFASDGGGIYSGGTLLLVNTIVAGNIVGYSGYAPDIYGTVASTSSNNLIGDGTGLEGISDGDAYNNQVGTSTSPIDPLLGPLGNYGGPTQTIPLQSGSSAQASGGPVTTLTAAITDPTSTTIAVQDAAAIASTAGNYLILIDGEQMLVTNVDLTTNTLTMARGHNGTSPAMHSAGASVYLATDQRGWSRSTTQDIGAFQTQTAVQAISPQLGSVLGGTVVTITGFGLANASAINFGSTAVTHFLSDSPNQIVLNSPAEAAGLVDVTVTTPNCVSAPSSADQFTYTQAPIVTGITPALPVTQGTSVTISGANLANATAVHFGSIAVTTFTSDVANQIVVNAPAEVAGTSDLTVTTANGTSALSPADHFTYVARTGYYNTLASAIPLVFAFNQAQATAFLATPNQVDLYQVHLNAGDQVSITANGQANGLVSLLRVFDANGQPIALDDQEGGDPRLTFQAATTNEYVIGVSASGDDAYNPSVAGSGQGGTSTGLYSLALQLTPGAQPQADLAGSSFRLASPDTAVWGGTVQVQFRVENRGAVPAAADASVQLLLSDNNTFGPTAQVYPLGSAISLANLASGGNLTGSSMLTLPNRTSALTAGFSASGPVYVGLQITDDPAIDANPFDKSGVERGEDWESLTIVTPVSVGVTDLSAADPGLNTQTNPTISTLEPAQTYTFTTTALGSGRLTATAAATSGTLVPRLVLDGPKGQMLIQSDDASIVQHLLPGTYSLIVSARSGTGSYQLTTEFVEANSPLEPIKVGLTPASVVVADLTGDGIPDLVTANEGDDNVAVLLGNGDGSFRTAQTYSVGQLGDNANSLAVADLNGDGKLDLITADYLDGTVSVLVGNGDGTFHHQQTFDAGPYPGAVAVADLSGDGEPDIIVTNERNNTVSVLMNTTAPGSNVLSFAFPQSFAVGSDPRSLAVADLNGDGRPDLVVANYYGVDVQGTVSVLLNTTALSANVPTFRAQTAYHIGYSPGSVAVADLTGDGKPDIVVANDQSNSVSVLLGNGDGTFKNQKTFDAGFVPFSMAVGDVNGDGTPDIVVGNFGGHTVSVLRGIGDGSFEPPQSFATGSYIGAVAVADLNGDGKPDIIVANSGSTYNPSDTVSVLQGNGDGSFQAPPTVAAGATPVGTTVADLTGNGKEDIVVANQQDKTVSVLLGNGDGSFQARQTIALSAYPSTLAVADVNGDGKPDLIIAYNNYTVSVLLGNGDGTFQDSPSYLAKHTFEVGSDPVALAVADLGNGNQDIITTNGDGTVTVLLGNGDGTFQDNPSTLKQHTFQVGFNPQSVTVADINGDGIPDLVVANRGGYYNSYLYPGSVSVLLGNGNGTFKTQALIPAGYYASSVAVADLSGDGKADLVVGHYIPPGGFLSYYNYPNNVVSVLLNTTPKGAPTVSFAPQQMFSAGADPQSVAVADVNGDGRLDILSANFRGNSVSVLTGNGDGTFGTAQSFSVGFTPDSLNVVDVNGDGIPDVVVGNEFAGSVTVLLGNGQGSFTPATPDNEAGTQNTPYLAHFNGSTFPDSVILDSAGNILFRQGLSDDSFAPPVILNPSNPARDITLVETPEGLAIAAADLDPTLVPGHSPIYTVSLYTFGANGNPEPHQVAFTTALLPTRIVAGDLTGNRLDDLVVANSLDNSIQVAFQQPNGTFSDIITRPTDEAPSDIALVPVQDPNGLPDIVASNQASGNVTVFYNGNTHTFATSSQFLAGLGLYGLDVSGAGITSREQSVSLAAGNLTGDRRNDLVVLNRGSHSFTVLVNDGNGGFSNPQPLLTTSTSMGLDVPNQPSVVVLGDFNQDGSQDVAILMEDTKEIWVYLNKGNGTFTAPIVSSVGTFGLPTGLTFVPRTGDQPDHFLVGNAFGDILTLVGDDTGHFKVDTSILAEQLPLAVGQTPDGRTFVVLADQSKDQVNVYFLKTGTNQFASPIPITTQTQTLLAPGSVQLINLANEPAGDPTRDLVVVDRLGNDVLVYPGNADGTFGNPTSYPVGDEPVSVTAAYLKGDNVLDLAVVNQGSNDISILFGSIVDGNWQGTEGPRLKSGGSAPLVVEAGNFTGRPGIDDLRVINSGGQIVTLPGIGSEEEGTGFFEDNSPQIVNLGATILKAIFDPSTDEDFLVLQGGALVSFHGKSVASLVGSGVADISADDGVLAVAMDNGSFEVIVEASVASATFTSGVFSDEPSALEALVNGSQLDVFATYQGMDRPVFYSFTIPELTNVGHGPPVVVLLELEESNLGVATVLSGGLAELIGDTLTAPGVQTVEQFAFVNLGQVLLAEEEFSAQALPLAGLEKDPQAFQLGVEQALEENKLYRKTTNDLGNLMDGLQRLIPLLEDLWQGPPPVDPMSQRETPNPKSEIPKATENADSASEAVVPSGVVEAEGVLGWVEPLPTDLSANDQLEGPGEE